MLACRDARHPLHVGCRRVRACVQVVPRHFLLLL
jgi:hypothetical protein